MDPLQSIHAEVVRTGYVVRRDLVGPDMDDSTFTHFAHRLGLSQLQWGVWAPSDASLTHAQQARAALASIGESALVTGLSALHVYRMQTAAPEEVHLVVPLGRSPVRRDGVCVHHTSTYDSIRYQTVDGIQVAAPPRAFCDYANHATKKDLAFALAWADRERRLIWPQLVTEFDRRKRFPGRTVLRALVDDFRDETTHSDEERKARRLIRAAGFVPHRRPLTVVIAGSPRAEIDIPFADISYGVEVDGPHHLLPHVAAADRARDRALSENGWTIDRFFWFEIDERPEWFVKQVVKRIAALTPPGQSPSP